MSGYTFKFTQREKKALFLFNSRFEVRPSQNLLSIRPDNHTRGQGKLSFIEFEPKPIRTDKEGFEGIAGPKGPIAYEQSRISVRLAFGVRFRNPLQYR